MCSEYDSAFDINTEKAVKNIFADSKNVSVSSKLSRYNDMLGNEKQIRILGYGIGLIIAFLAVLNYINMMTAGVHNRKKEFATLESIGMTTKQIQRVLMKEGIECALVSITLSLIIGIPSSWFVFQSMKVFLTRV